MINFIDKNSDIDTLNYLSKSLGEDTLEKAELDKTKLVLMRGKDGRNHWMRPDKDVKKDKPSAPKQEEQVVKLKNFQRVKDVCAGMKKLPKFDTSEVTDMTSMFNGCKSLEKVPAMDTSNVYAMNSMFSGCRKLKEIPAMDTSSVSDMQYMFYGCSNLEKIGELDFKNIMSRFDVSNIFKGCDKLKEVNVKNIRPNVLSHLQKAYPNIKFNVEK